MPLPCTGSVCACYEMVGNSDGDGDDGDGDDDDDAAAADAYPASTRIGISRSR